MNPSTIAKCLLTVLIGAAVWGAQAEMSVDVKDGIVTYTVPAGETATLSSAFAGTKGVVKDGDGKLILKAANASYTAPIDVKKGILVASVVKSLGSSEVTVWDGARLETDLQSCAQGTCYFPDSKIRVQGNGPDGKGSLGFYGTGMGDRLFANVELLADARFCGNRRWGIAGDSFKGSLNLNGHTLDLALENAGPNTYFMFNGGNCAVVNMGNIIGRSLTFQGTPSFGGNTSNHLRMNYKTGYVNLWGASTNVIPWTMDVEEDCYLRSGGDTGKSRSNNRWNTPITIAAGKTLTISSYDNENNLVDVRNGISGGGRLVKASGNDFYMDGAATQTGGTLISGGIYFTGAAKTLARCFEPGAVAVTNEATIHYWVDGDGNWKPDSIVESVKAADWAKTAYVGYNLGKATVQEGYDFGKPVSLRHRGSALTFRQPVHGFASLWNDSGDFTFDVDEAFDAQTLAVSGGKLVVMGGAKMNLLGTKETQEIKGGGKLVLTNAMIKTERVKGRRILVSGGGSIEIQEGAVISNRIDIANGTGLTGAVYQRGGYVKHYAGPENDAWAGSGSNSYGFYELSGGTLAFDGWFGFGHNTSAGVFQMTDGCLDVGILPFGRGGYCRAYLKGGTVKCSSNIYLGEQQWGGGENLGDSWVTIAGTGVVVEAANNIQLCQRTNNYTAVLNLNAGIVSTPVIYEADYSKALRSANARSFVNCNGGTYRAYGHRNEFLGAVGYELDRVTLFEKGLTIDTAGYTLRNNTVPLQKPVGRGVKSITYTGTQTGYLGSPVVSIEGGGGEGATAYVEFDSLTGKIGNVVVTSPGWNYTSAPTVKFLAPDRKTEIVCAVELTPENEEQVGGGLRKIGAGELKIGKACTYTGDTVISNGTLSLEVANALPVGNTVLLATGDGVFNIGSQNVTVAGFGGAGRVTGSGTLKVTDTLRFDGNDVAADKTLTVDVTQINFGDIMKVEISNTNALDATGKRYTLMKVPGNSAFHRVPELVGLKYPWRLRLADGGRELRIRCQYDSLTLIIR